MFTVCAGLVFRSKYVRFPVVCSVQYSININTVEVDPHSVYSVVKPKNSPQRPVTVFIDFIKSCN